MFLYFSSIPREYPNIKHTASNFDTNLKYGIVVVQKLWMIVQMTHTTKNQHTSMNETVPPEGLA